MSISSIYAELLRRARETGEDRAITLTGGARLAVRVHDDIVTLTISRKGKHVGATEIEVFKRDCSIPATAIRFPLDAQGSRSVEGATWWYVAYRWREGEST